MKIVNIFVGGGVRLLQGTGDKPGYRQVVIDPVVSSLNSRDNQEELFVVKTFADFQHEMTPGGHQKQFNHYIRNEADIAVFILDGRMGNKTKEELELALETSFSNILPIIYIYGTNIDHDDEAVQYLNSKKQYYQLFSGFSDLNSKLRNDLINHPILNRRRRSLIDIAKNRINQIRISNYYRRIMWISLLLLLIVLLLGLKAKYVNTSSSESKIEPLYPEISVYERNIATYVTETHILRIDVLKNGKYRYVSWKNVDSMRGKPSLILEGGIYSPGSHVYIFKNGNYDYIVGEKHKSNEKTFTKSDSLTVVVNGHILIQELLYNKQ